MAVHDHAVARLMETADDGGAESLGTAGNEHDFIHGEEYDAAPAPGQGHLSVDVPSRLPDPSAAELAISTALCDRIRRLLHAADGFLPFDLFMHEALFAPGLGYYLNGSRKFGAEGDFVTAPEISPLFGQALARQCLQARDYGDSIIEFGGGTGKLAASVLTALAEVDALPARYLILELSPELRAQQQRLLRSLPFADALDIDWLQDAPATPLAGVIIANEILDSLPTAAFALRATGFVERGIGLDANGAFEWRERAASGRLAEGLSIRLKDLTLPVGYRSEINLQQALWLADLPRFIDRGIALLFDYGGPRRELYHPERGEGTLRCYWRHRLHANPLWLPGLQDITASVDFTSVAEAALDAGLTLLGYATQASFLLANGIEARLQAAMQADPGGAMRLAAQARMLLLPSEMGTSFKAMAIGVGDVAAPAQFSMRDERHQL